MIGKVRNIFAVNVGRYTKTAPEQRIAFASAKSIWDEATQKNSCCLKSNNMAPLHNSSLNLTVPLIFL